MNKNRPPNKIDCFSTKWWYDDNGKLHNDDNCHFPAMIFESGTKMWFNHGNRHNDFGPAIIFSSGRKEWWIDDKQYTEEEFKQHKIKQFIGDIK